MCYDCRRDVYGLRLLYCRRRHVRKLGRCRPGRTVEHRPVLRRHRADSRFDGEPQENTFEKVFCLSQQRTVVMNKMIATKINVIENNEIIYDSITIASRQTKISKVKIYNMCTIQKDLIFKNFKFKFVNEDQFIKRPKIIYEPIIQLNYDYELQRVFICTDDIKDICKSANIHLILKSCKSNGAIMHYNSRWIFLKEYNKAFNVNIVPEIKIVLLTERLKFKKLYTNAFDLISDGFNINSAIKHCKHKSVSNKDRCWMFLDDFLKFKNINSLNELGAQDISKK